MKRDFNTSKTTYHLTIRRRLVLLLGSSILAWLMGCAVASASPQRIVTLAPSLAEIVASLLAPPYESIVGVTEYTDFPEGLKSIKTIGSYAQFDLERVVALKPDLIVATRDGNPKDSIHHLQELKLPVLVVDTQHLSDISRSVLSIGHCLGKAQVAQSIAQSFDRELQKLKVKDHDRKPKIFLQIGDEPLVTVGRGSLLNEELEWIGAQNIYSDLKSAYPRPAIEDVLHRNPDLIIILSMERNPVQSEKIRRRWLIAPHIRPEQVQILRADTLARPTPRVVEGMRILKDLIRAGSNR